MKNFLAFILAISIVFALPSSAFAVDSQPVIKNEESIIYRDEKVIVTQQYTSMNSQAAADYGSTWLNQSGSGNFKVTTSRSGTIGITLKVESASQNSYAIISLVDPHGNTFKNNIRVTPSSGNGEGVLLKIYSADSGTYTVNYVGSTNVGMRIMCWMY